MKITNKQIEKILEAHANSLEGMGVKLTVVHFNEWISGFVTGFSINNPEMTQELFEKEIDEVVKSEQAKRFGVTGTLKESFKTQKI